MRFVKGHGTENDFVIVNDHDGQLQLPARRVAALCDRRAGIGGDGLLRVIRTEALVAAGEIAAPSAGDPLAECEWFMDYRNADGSIAEMCGNGTRVFAHWLRSTGLAQTDEFSVGTRAGAKAIRMHSFDATDALVSVEMGAANVVGLSTARMAGKSYAGLAVDVGNPHLAAVVPGLSATELAHLPFVAPEFDAEFFPHGVNLEVLTQLAEGHVHMRVFERGVGETRSCGTGTVAAARAALADACVGEGTVAVHVPGGQVTVAVTDGGSVLTGPSKIVAQGETTL